MIKEMVCIVCPMSCKLSVEMENDKVKNVSGNTCIRGVKYAREELTNPTRMVTSTVFIKNAALTRLPVATRSPIPKSKINDVMKQINKVKVKAPVSREDIIIKNVCRTGVDIIATRSMDVQK